MGIASSSNIANAIEQVTNDVLASAQTDSSIITECVNSQTFINCDVDKITIQNVCDVMQKAQSIINQRNTSALNSSVAQRLLQQATSKIGSMGVGYASASNIVSALVQNSNTISNSLYSNSSQVTNILNQFTCIGSKIGNLDISNLANIQSLVDQVLTQADVSTLVSTVSQDISQTASATVEGLAAFIIALAILIVAIGYVAFKPFGMLLGNKMVVFVALAVLIAAVITFMYWKQVPPFFNPPTECATNVAVGGCADNVECINTSNGQTANITSPPMRYALDLIGSTDTPGLLTMLISRIGESIDDTAGGWNANVYQYFEKNPIGVYPGNNTPLPNPLDGNYDTNLPGWNGISDPGMISYARFMLCKKLGIDVSVYIFDSEMCSIGGVDITNPSGDARCFKFIPSIIPTDLSMAVNSGGKIVGPMGVCNNTSYKLQSFMKKGGIAIPIVLFIAMGAFIIFYNPATKPTANAPSASTSGSGSIPVPKI